MPDRSKVIMDCDNSFGLFGCDIDDGLALLYLLGDTMVDLLGVTLSHGNASLPRTAAATRRLLRHAGRDGLPVHPGANRVCGQPQRTLATDFILEQTARYPGEITLLVTGPLTNIAAALAFEPGLADRLKAIYVMGGLTGPLRLGRLRCRELNIAADPDAAATVLSLRDKVTLFPAQSCLASRIGWHEIMSMKGVHPYLRYQILRWLACFSLKYGTGHIHPWDLLPALAIRHPGLFRQQYRQLDPCPARLAEGYLPLAEGTGLTVVSGLKDAGEALRLAREAWCRSLPWRQGRHSFRATADSKA